MSVRQRFLSFWGRFCWWEILLAAYDLFQYFINGNKISPKLSIRKLICDYLGEYSDEVCCCMRFVSDSGWEIIGINTKGKEHSSLPFVWDYWTTIFYLLWCGSSETLSFVRPFLRRAFKTLRPLAVDILSRNPCLLILFLFDGWNVLFISDKYFINLHCFFYILECKNKSFLVDGKTNIEIECIYFEPLFIYGRSAVCAICSFSPFLQMQEMLWQLLKSRNQILPSLPRPCHVLL